MNENEIGREIVDSAVHVHQTLGPGLLESVYEIVLCHELENRGLKVERQVPVKIQYKNMTFSEAFRADVLVENKIILELKSVEELQKVHYKQLLTYLRLKELKLGYLLNFGSSLMKEGIKRVVNGLKDENLAS